MTSSGEHGTPFAGWAGPVSMAAAGLIVLTQVAGLLTARQTAGDLPQVLNNVLELVAVILLLLALVGLYARQSPTTGRIGVAGFLVAFVGTTLLAGDWWFEAFVGPVLAEVAPQVMDLPPGGLLLAGGVATFALFSIGWVLFGIATLRGRIFPRGAAALLMVGGAIGLLAGTPPFQIPLALAVGWMGFWLSRDKPGERAV